MATDQNPNTDISNICKLLSSEDFKDRVRGEYLLLKDKCEKLRIMLEKYATGTLEFQPKCSFEILFNQYDHMTSYLNILELRAKIEGFELY